MRLYEVAPQTIPFKLPLAKAPLLHLANGVEYIRNPFQYRQYVLWKRLSRRNMGLLLCVIHQDLLHLLNCGGETPYRQY